MNRLLWPNGGVKLDAQDFIFAEEAIRQAFAGLCSGFAQVGKVLVLSGCEVSFNSGNATVSEGYLVIDNEILYNPAQTVSTMVGQSFQNFVNINLHIFSDPAGFEGLSNQTSADTYQIRQARVFGGKSNTDRDNDKWVRLSSSLFSLVGSTKRLYNVASNDLSVGFASVPTNPFVVQSFYSVKLRGQLNISGISANTDVLVSTLPEGFRPSSLVLMWAVGVTNTGAFVPVLSTLTPLGELYVNLPVSQIASILWPGTDG